MKTVAIVLAAGSGSRMKSDVKKQYMEIGGKPLIYYSLKAFEESIIDDIVLVVSRGDEEYVRNEIVDKYHFDKVTAIVEGGLYRYHSVRRGLMAAAPDCDYAFIHDGARPFVNDEIIMRALRAVKEHGACVVGMPVKDTIKISDDEGFARETPDRAHTWMIQTPQVFSYKMILELYQKLDRVEEDLMAKGVNITDDAMVVEYFTDKKVKLVEGSYTNIKITTPEDIPTAEAILRNR
ncbi:2-C-methyl-D-erythritol 4-phosphate cytidylyltransferase IspD1 [Butyrivibrio proteoclasticus B316]|uniref:2-C-methyl-D-erythritol 4-phosphate cytidylyltransferase n=1 Tax=Butyrivibrio proteoclasticus (strain ATCC 51982 / DSM 14932 / B316) TaxID=515622 RepID=E0S0J2_BUTPB|nr:2-C-methyl-D-erythritol 4-phosphate cytidylyltransferase [Butyrivibrio proteoclasticus]ADL33317.1 2-C-methyl-D-erythritol 4-phosphate cytidylyltransferase IspD1 [Butyrivibrio proteoclasticus B316]